MTPSERFIPVTREMIVHNLLHLPQLVFEVTDACNLNCKYCGYSDLYQGYDRREDKYLSFEKAKSLLDYLTGMWRKHFPPSLQTYVFISFYGGEPLLNMPFVKKVIEYLESLPPAGKQYVYSMTSNAMLLDRHMDYLAEKRFHLLVSLDGDREADSYRTDRAGRPSFDRVYRNVCALRKKHPAYFERFVNFNSVIHNRNSVESTHRFIREHFGKPPRLAPLNNSGIRPDKKEEFERTYRNIYESFSQASDCEQLEADMFLTSPRVSRLLEFTSKYSGNTFQNFNYLLIDPARLKLTPTGTCHPFGKKMFVTVNGKILQCEKINHEFALGRIGEDGRIELDPDRIARRHNDYIFRYVRQCRSCAIQDSCSQCVFQIDDLAREGSRCRSYRTQAQQERFVNSALDYLRDHPRMYRKTLEEISIS